MVRIDESAGPRCVVLEDDGRVAYAYLLDNESIVGDVWLYNVVEDPEAVDWQDQSAMPFLNPAQYSTSEVLDRIRDDSDVCCFWAAQGVAVTVGGVLWAHLESGSKPGWSRKAKVSGPLAKPLKSFGIYGLAGGTVSADELKMLERELGLRLSATIAAMLMSLPLIGLTFTLDDEDDQSGLGCEIEWMTVEQMIDESLNAYPGVVAVSRGLLAVGNCLMGSGDPYFLRIEDGAVVRVPHEAATENDLDLEQVELVASSVMDLVDLADTESIRMP
ncbi:hypothetical protein JYT15_01045 [Acidimicrobium ferrooxidans]|nr:hypothetical protein [Acidimicrobium ferrooxidans]